MFYLNVTPTTSSILSFRTKSLASTLLTCVWLFSKRLITDLDFDLPIQVIIWKETSNGWAKLQEFCNHDSSGKVSLGSQTTNNVFHGIFKRFNMSGCFQKLEVQFTCVSKRD